MTEPKISEWSCEGGRALCYGGVPVVNISKPQGTEPVLADALTHLFADLLNRQGYNGMPNSIIADYMRKP